MWRGTLTVKLCLHVRVSVSVSLFAEGVYMYWAECAAPMRTPHKVTTHSYTNMYRHPASALSVERNSRSQAAGCHSFSRTHVDTALVMQPFIAIGRLCNGKELHSLTSWPTSRKDTAERAVKHSNLVVLYMARQWFNCLNVISVEQYL